jgi:protein O-mannosyl-transferase
MDRIKDSRLTLLIGLLLTAAISAVFWPAVNHDFVNYDDNCYVYQNMRVQAGLTWKGLAWAFGRLHGDGTYWHPLTWVSHMLDCQLFGLKPAGHHLVNLLLHTLNSVLVFLVLKRMTRALWRSALLAALFALHPLQVDTVAWVAERKNLLSALFFILTIWAYGRYAEGPEVRSPRSGITNHESRFYLLSLFFFVCGLMCKPVLVTLPFVLLLLDYWPLERIAYAGRTDRQRTLTSWRRLITEKLPFLALSLASSAITIASNRAVGAMLDTSAGFPLEIRIQNALFSFIKYIGKALWPLDLAVFYPYPVQFPIWRAVACGLLLLAISGLAVATARSRPYFLVGWCWFLVVLAPFIGLIQAGEQAMADRFTYVPLIGLFLMIVWGLAELNAKTAYDRPWPRIYQYLRVVTPTLVSLVALVCCAVLSHRQIGYWQNSVTLFSHALAVTGNNARAETNLGMALAAQGKVEEGIQHLLETLRLNPGHAVAHWAVGVGRAQQGRFDEAIQYYEAALRLKPDFPEALNNLAWLRATNPDPNYRNGAAAVELAERGCRLTARQEPLFIGTLGAAYAETGRFEDAIKAAEQAEALAAAAGLKEVANKNQQLLELFRAGTPYHEAVAGMKH